MNPTELRKSLENGVIAFPVTPFKDDLSLDLEGLRSNLERMVQHDFRAIVAAGEPVRCTHCHWTSIAKW